tara:strand:+ start:270 stop:554 length:285 start_codon:yes stop_codon:yes gene_type:complete
MSGISKRYHVIRREIPDNACGVSGMTVTLFFQSRKNSALFPGQAIVAPAAGCTAVVIVIELSFKAVLYVIDMAESMIDEQFAGFLGAVTATANQ